jgi:hypothetical protein
MQSGSGQLTQADQLPVSFPGRGLEISGLLRFGSLDFFRIQGQHSRHDMLPGEAHWRSVLRNHTTVI